MASLPTHLAEITPDWLTDALSQRSPGTKVRGVEIDETIGGTASKVFLRVDYEHRSENSPPEMLCLKGGFDDKMREMAGLGYRVESLFYRDIAPDLGQVVPRCWYAAEHEAENQGLLLIDDLRSSARFGQPEDQYDVDQVAAALEIMAGWHGRSWNRSGIGSAKWLSVGSPLFRPVAEWFTSSDHWQNFITLEQTRSFDDSLRDRERLVTALHKLWALDDADALSVSHGDPHPRNTYALEDGALRFLDWQTTCLAPWADDVAYFLVGILDAEERRKHESDLLRHYMSALAAAGGPALEFDDAFLAYRRHHLHGLMFALCPPEMQPAEVCTLMGDRYATAAIEHDTLRAIEE
ncbi:phosphotransferase [Nocardia sp. ET3-3]|uniref:Phosphotransferase n=1 Tax=Nocardia terrae TaxID=2675851 RepID=A0A7K1V3H9_9NOCA|nr:phosphotransferase [Nocardia terrae]MVU80698.1 phosphotransferase [Nocardia terrae]